jgi:Asp-tRNA(Asn)/Glu-tRNA(Gln) amidotransferase A subunit family amidase
MTLVSQTMPELVRTTDCTETPVFSGKEITRFSASELASLVRRKQLSPVEIIEAHLRRAEQLDPVIKAFASLEADRAMAAARQAEKDLISEQKFQPLLGIPVSIKSCIDVQGFRCEAGSRLRSGYIAAQDAPLVARLKSAGAIIIGNTSTPEALVSYHTENLPQGRTNNPYDLMRSAGGSSGGEAAAIACGLSAGGIGSDGGGSIRVPASFCGICGLKPTPGRIPATGHYPPCGGPFSLIGAVGPMARTVEDLRLLLEVTSGYDPGDPVSAPVPFSSGNNCDRAKLRIGFYEDDGYSLAEPAVQEAVRLSAAALAEDGFVVEPFRPSGLERARQLWFTLFVEAIAMVLAPVVQGRENEISASTTEFLAFAAEQPPLTGERLLTALLERDQLRAQFLGAMERFPILLAPVCAIPAFAHDDAGWGALHKADYARTMSYSQHYNLLGTPAATVPVAQTSSGLPVGVQIVGRPYKEDEVLAVAGMLDQKFGWREPPLTTKRKPQPVSRDFPRFP